MSGTGLGAVLLMIGMVMLVMRYWKQIAIFLLFVTVTVFCLGIYFIVSTIGLLVPWSPITLGQSQAHALPAEAMTRDHRFSRGACVSRHYTKVL
jgi:hypothetical protein